MSTSSQRNLRFLPASRRSSPSRAKGRPGAGTGGGGGKPVSTRIGIFGQFGSGNLGNDGSMESFLGFLRADRPGAELVSICHTPELIGERFSIPTVPIRPQLPGSPLFRGVNKLLLGAPNRLLDLIRAVRIARGFDVILVPGTGILDDFGERWKDMPYILFNWTLACRLAGTPFAFVSIGAGPIVHPFSRWLMKSAARMAHYRSYRDEQSKRYMAGIGLDRPGDRVTPDLAFRLPLPEKRNAASAKPMIGLGMMGYSGWKHAQADGEAIYRAYIAKMAAFGKWLLDGGYGVRLIVGDKGDRQAVLDVGAALAKRPGTAAGDVIAEPAESLTDVMRQIAETELLVATRFHNVVCGLMVGKPVISIGYARKNDVLLAEAGLADFCQHIERLDVDALKLQFEQLMRDRDRHIPEITAMAANYRSALAEQEQQMLRELF
ncbi:MULTISPECIES: polysaccharide pyruvyl transferase family protein [Rhodomicrobium]|uniref:polysaccharide pyruvyl transferase family protein n=1 Tax=Rhodomicrobium TaxID=1068 RepID=UPI000B4B1800|nr:MULTISPECIES: polysaccharide pyruvyl transferase family protein [Rhodomicrobium]